MIILFIAFCICFIFDYNTIKHKLTKDILIKVRGLEHEYEINRCEEKGYLQALKAKCESLKHEIIIHKNVNLN